MGLMEKEIYQYILEHKEEIIQDLITLVQAESPSNDKQAVDKCGAVLNQLYMERLGVTLSIDEQETTGNNLYGEIGDGEKKILLLGHFDTVHAIGAVPIRREKDRLYGPGVIDMKGGDIALIWALKALKEQHRLGDHKFVIVHNADEEIGSFHSRKLILEKAEGCAACVVAEPAEVVTGKVKLSRKGVGSIKIICHGKAAHAGNAYLEGCNANLELAHQILFASELTDYEAGTTLSPNVISGGSVLNIISDNAQAEIDWRVSKLSEVARVEEAFCEKKTFVKGTGVEYEMLLARPPFEETEENQKLYSLLCEVGKNMGIKVEKCGMSGGASDGNNVAATGIPTIDGMGVSGDCLHNPNEHIYLDEIVDKVALLSAFLNRI